MLSLPDHHAWKRCRFHLRLVPLEHLGRAGAFPGHKAAPKQVSVGYNWTPVPTALENSPKCR